MSGPAITLILLALFLVAFLIAWSMVRVGEARDAAIADAVEARADQIVKDMQARVGQQTERQACLKKSQRGANTGA